MLFARLLCSLCLCLCECFDLVSVLVMHRFYVQLKVDTCYSAACMSQTRDQQLFTISEVAADRHEPMVLQCIVWLSIARANG